MASTAAVLNILINANTGQATAAMKRTQAQLGATAAAAQRSGAKTSAAMAASSAAIVKGAKFGAFAVAAGAAATVVASAKYESAFAGVRKTVDATEKQYAELSDGIRSMAKEIPASTTELSRIAEAAGQLGIQRTAILGFTKTVAALGETTNLSGDAAATSLARIANIMGTSQQHFDRLGSTIVDLGNKGASTEREIVEMALRIAGAGKQVGLTEAQVLSFANSLSSVGVEAESGGSAISRTFIKIAEAAAKGGDKLSGFAKVAGMSSADFKKAFEVDAAGATIEFIEGLDGIKKSGGSVFSVLEDLGLQEIRVRDALLRASGAGDLFRESMVNGNKAWKKNTALVEEAEQRYGTLESQFQVLGNRINDVAISLGDKLTPTLKSALQVINSVEMPDLKSQFGGSDGESFAKAMKTVGVAVSAVAKLLEFSLSTALTSLKFLFRASAAGLQIFVGILSGDFKMALRSAGALAMAFVTVLSDSVRPAIKLVTGLFGMLPQSIRKPLGKVVAFVSGAFGSVVGVIKGAQGAIVGAAGAVWDAVKARFTSLAGPAGRAMSHVAGAISDVTGVISKAAKAVWDKVKEVLTAPIRMVVNIPKPSIPNPKSLIEKLPGFASGTNNFPGGLAVVGERGPEIVALQRGAKILSNAKSRQLAGSITPSPVSRSLSTPVSSSVAGSVTIGEIRVFVGDREITDIVRTEIDGVDAEDHRSVRAGTRPGGN